MFLGSRKREIDKYCESICRLEGVQEKEIICKLSAICISDAEQLQAVRPNYVTVSRYRVTLEKHDQSRLIKRSLHLRQLCLNWPGQGSPEKALIARATRLVRRPKDKGNALSLRRCRYTDHRVSRAGCAYL